jgi:hypothetical protein
MSLADPTNISKCLFSKKLGGNACIKPMTEITKMVKLIAGLIHWR